MVPMTGGYLCPQWRDGHDGGMLLVPTMGRCPRFLSCGCSGQVIRMVVMQQLLIHRIWDLGAFLSCYTNQR